MGFAKWCKRIFIVVGLILGLVNVGLFLLWSSLVNVESIKHHTYALDDVAFMVNVMGVILTVLSVVLAVLGVLGYAEIRLKAESIARETAREVASKESKEAAEQLKKDVHGLMSRSTQPSVSDAPSKDDDVTDQGVE